MAERRPAGTPGTGRVRFGDLRRLAPLSDGFGYDRGRPVDRPYIEGFLERRRLAIRGRVLEVADDAYARRFGGARVTATEVLDVVAENPKATIVADLERGEAIESAAYDCVILTQTLHLMHDVDAALATVHRVLKPGGVLLATVPGIPQLSRDDRANRWQWSFTPSSARRRLEAAFPGGRVEVESRGNVLVAAAFLYGLAAEDLRPEELAVHDPRYPVVVAAQAVKAGEVAGVDPARPAASVVIPCHDQAAWLPEAIGSVLAQTSPGVEIVVVDDGSTDDTAEVAGRFPVRLLRQSRRGLPAARNAGLAASRGEIVVFLDADDRLLPGAVETGLRELRAHPECAFAAGHHRRIGADGAVVAEWPGQAIAGGHYLGLLHRNFVSAVHAVAFRREAVEEAGGFDEALGAAEDYELMLRLAWTFPVRIHDVLVAEYRRHDRNMTGDPARLLEWTLRVLERQEERVRGHAAHRAARDEGVRHFREVFGDPLVGEVRARLRRGELAAAARGARALARWHPAGLAHLLVGERAAAAASRAAGAVGRGLRAARDGARAAAGRASRSARAAGLDEMAEVVAWLRADVERKDRTVAHRDEAIAWLRSVVESKERVVAEREAAIAWLEERLAERERVIAARDEAIAWLQGELAALRERAESGEPRG